MEYKAQEESFIRILFYVEVIKNGVQMVMTGLRPSSTAPKPEHTWNKISNEKYQKNHIAYSFIMQRLQPVSYKRK